MAKEGVSKASAGAILASATRKASPAAKVANPHLNNVLASHARGYFRQKMPK